MKAATCKLTQAILVALLIGACASNQCTPVRNDRGAIQRSSSAINSFKSTHPCPSNGNRRGPCKGYVIDHIIPLKRCGADSPRNMQWQTIAEAKAKDRWE